MRKIIIICFLLVLATGKGQTTAELSESFLKKMLRSQFDSCITYFDTSVISKLNPSMMQEIWERIPTYVGEFKSYEDIRTEKNDSIEAVLIRCAFEKTKLDLKFAYNKQKKIIGFFFIPPKSKNTYNIPDYYEATKLYETKLSVKTGTFEMPGLMCVPNNITDPPVVILLAGSGPNDKDESIGPNKPLKDIALGLASKGIASLRYDKRSLAQGSKMDVNKTGLNEEVVDDAISAVKILRQHALTKNSKIFIAGHSLGAMCAPLIASKCKDVSGVIMIAGPARSLEDVIAEQILYLTKDEVTEKELLKTLEDTKKQTAIVKDPKALKNAKASELPLGAPSFYWQSIKNYDQIKVAKKVKQPILVLQGERDYQVTMTDFNIWKKELGTDSKNKFISYPGLNHLLQNGEGKSGPSEYDLQKNVDLTLITDIINFVKSIK